MSDPFSKVRPDTGPDGAKNDRGASPFPDAGSDPASKGNARRVSAPTQERKAIPRDRLARMETKSRLLIAAFDSFEPRVLPLSASRRSAR